MTGICLDGHGAPLMIVQGTKSLYEDLAGCILDLLSLTSIVYGIGFEICFRVLLYMPPLAMLPREIGPQQINDFVL